jgi:hypothetical protein
MNDNGKKIAASSLIRRRLRMKSSYILPFQRKQIDAQITIASWWKHYIKFKKIVPLSKSAIIIQKNWRAFKGRLIYQETLLELHNAAALMIQLSWKRYNPKLQCPICLEYLAKNNFLFIDHCNHYFCSNCISQLISHSISNAINDIPIKCPNLSCSGTISYSQTNISQFCSPNDLQKWEYWEIMKTHIPEIYIKYCPRSDCGLPYDSSWFDNQAEGSNSTEIFSVLCPECRYLFCGNCNQPWQRNHQCNNQTDTEIDDSSKQYINQHCKRCPGCNSAVQKHQTSEQSRHQNITGLSGGTEDCHHVTCANCKTDFCWTCLSTYDGLRYYHPECPTADCNIRFNNDIPRLVRLPPHISFIVLKTENTSTKYSVSGQKIGTIPLTEIYPTSDTLLIICNNDGIVTRINSIQGDYTYRQENRRTNAINESTLINSNSSHSIPPLLPRYNFQNNTIGTPTIGNPTIGTPTIGYPTIGQATPNHNEHLPTIDTIYRNIRNRTDRNGNHFNPTFTNNRRSNM